MSSPSAWCRARPPALGAVLAALAIALAEGASAAPAAAQAPGRGCPGANMPTRSAPMEEIRTAVICLVNRERAVRHLPALRQSYALDRSAQEWSRTMVQTDTFSHGASFTTRITAAGLRWSVAGENIATGSATARDVVAAWMHSAGHCRNILDPEFRVIGVGMDPRPVRGWANGPATWTEDFALPAGRHAPSRNWAPANGCPH
ncbi:MAG: CAP domain-containing protein [Actinomycetota bacterium]|nr:CAP domain-containing protein [Actinomycetota bacterium]